MKIPTTGQNESFLRSMIRNVQEAMDCLPEQLRLAVWFNSCLRFTPLETAEILSAPVNSVGYLDDRAVRSIRESLGKSGIHTDDGSVRGVLCVLPEEPAPERLKRKIDDIVTGRATEALPGRSAFRSRRGYGRNMENWRLFRERRCERL
jgi:hypothetical protein